MLYIHARREIAVSFASACHLTGCRHALSHVFLGAEPAHKNNCHPNLIISITMTEGRNLCNTNLIKRYLSMDVSGLGRHVRII